MKVAIADAPALRLPAFSREAVPQFYRLAGLLLAVGVPALFWTAALGVLGRALGFSIGPAGLATAAMVIGTLAFMGASLAMAGRSSRT